MCIAGECWYVLECPPVAQPALLHSVSWHNGVMGWSVWMECVWNVREAGVCGVCSVCVCVCVCG